MQSYTTMDWSEFFFEADFEAVFLSNFEGSSLASQKLGCHKNAYKKCLGSASTKIVQDLVDYCAKG